MANSVVFGIFSTTKQVETAVDEMKREGFGPADISVLLPPEDVAIKARSGSVIGSCQFVRIGHFREVHDESGRTRWLAGIGLLSIPADAGPVVVAGPVMTLTDGGSVPDGSGGLTQTLVGMGIPEGVAPRYEKRIKEGGIVLSIHAENPKEIRKATKVFDLRGAVDVVSTAEAKVGVSRAARILLPRGFDVHHDSEAPKCDCACHNPVHSYMHETGAIN